MEPFKYIPSRRIGGWGFKFDSLTELRFAISITDEYEFLRSRVSIFFDPKTKVSYEYIREHFRRYTPDFLMRHKETFEATLVEIKPRAFEHETQLIDRTAIAENYISRKGYDWKFRIIFDDEIILTEEQLDAYEHCRRNVKPSDYKAWWDEYLSRNSRGAQNHYTPGSGTAEFVMFGSRHMPKPTYRK